MQQYEDQTGSDVIERNPRRMPWENRRVVRAAAWFLAGALTVTGVIEIANHRARTAREYVIKTRIGCPVQDEVASARVTVLGDNSARLVPTGSEMAYDGRLISDYKLRTNRKEQHGPIFFAVGTLCINFISGDEFSAESPFIAQNEVTFICTPANQLQARRPFCDPIDLRP